MALDPTQKPSKRSILHNVCIIYYPPRSGFKKELMAYLQLDTDRIRCKYHYGAITLCGDFNELDQKWLSSPIGLDQVVKSPTRSDKSSNSRVNILCLTNADEKTAKFSAELFYLYCDTFPVIKVNHKSNCKPGINEKFVPKK